MVKHRLTTRRSALLRVATAVILTVLLVWGWQHRTVIHQVFVDLGLAKMTLCLVFLTLGVMLATLHFTLLVRSIGYPFTYSEGYHSLNLTQIAAMVPGRIWGFTGLVGLLKTRGLSTGDSLLVIGLHTLLTLSAAVCVGALSLVPLIGWTVTLLCLVPAGLLLAKRSWCDTVRQHFFPGSAPLPSVQSMLCMFIIGMGSWMAVGAGFALLVSSAAGQGAVSPLSAVGAFAASYVGGFVSILTPAGLGVREGIIMALLGPTLGHDQALAVAIAFRVLHMAVLWLHTAVSLGVVAYSRPVTYPMPEGRGFHPVLERTSVQAVLQRQPKLSAAPASGSELPEVCS